MPSRMIRYMVAERVAKEVAVKDLNRFKIGSLCPDMADSKDDTHFPEVIGTEKGINWCNFVNAYGERMQRDDLYLGVLCHLITDCVWFCEIMEPCIRAKAKSKEENQQGYQRGYLDFHRLNYILRTEFGLTYDLKEDRNIELVGLRHELYEEVFGGLYRDFYEEPPATKEELVLYPYKMTMGCIEHCITECIKEIQAFREGKSLGDPRRYYVPVRDWRYKL